MAALTGISGVILFTDAGVVDVLVAIVACDPDIPEVPFILFLVAGKAWSGEMSSFQLEFTGVVLLDGKAERGKSDGGMACTAVLNLSLLCELPFVVILVAVQTTVVEERFGKIVLMARAAKDCPVFVFQGKTGL